ncbi:MAG: nickel pincer cofactor biosynthesis protein LarB [Coriobacteriales bacterium]|jgi:NCAIR mutase (PurE)-related protein|nr:nickel pincer cofactor biosynthesis protein LarB [Coriobacteriales bacterium]
MENYVNIDFARAQRCGFPEVIFCIGKTAEQVGEIAARIYEEEQVVLATKATPEQAAAFIQALPEGYYEPECGLLWADGREDGDASIERLYANSDGDSDTTPKHAATPDGAEPAKLGRILVITAGTADLPIAKEAAITADLAGSAVEIVSDVGVAGIHRLLAKQAQIDQAKVLVVVAGMEGALPSVVAGLTDKPVIAVPTSVGYGANLHGITTLLSMLNSCANGVSVVNIDNGYGAGVIAHRINMLACQ